MEGVWSLLLDFAGRAKRWVLGQLGQSLDGCIATAEGQSHYVTGPQSLTHLHRLRALADAVIVGTATAEADNPQLTTRHVEGPSPTRVVLDRAGRLPGDLKAYTGDSGVCLRVAAPGAPDLASFEGVETLELPAGDAGFAPNELIAALAGRGLVRLLVEGGGRLVTSWYNAGALDRLHVVVAPFFLGAGRKGLDLPAVTDLPNLKRPKASHYSLGEDVLFDLHLRA